MSHEENMNLIKYQILKNYDTRMDHKKKKRYFTEEYIDDYKRIQVRACRICKFWKDKTIDDYELIFYQNILCLVVLTKI